MTRVVVHIDKLVLRGIDRSDATSISAGIESQLRHQLTQVSAVTLLAGGVNRNRVKPINVHLATIRDGQAIGSSIVSSITKMEKL
jgi:hypothetical protein